MKSLYSYAFPIIERNSFKEKSYSVKQEGRDIFSKEIKDAKPSQILFVTAIIIAGVVIISKKVDDKMEYLENGN